MSTPVAIGIDLGGTNVKVALVDRQGQITQKASCESNPARGPDRVIEDIVRSCRALLADAGTGIESVVGAGMGTPGPLDLRRGVILRSANLPDWRDVPIRDRIAAGLGVRVELDNDANVAAFGEFWAGGHYRRESGFAAVGQNDPSGSDPPVSWQTGADMVFFTLGTGVGGGIVVSGRILHGQFDNAAELGHMIVVAGGLRCLCGQHGCLEQYASASGIARRVTDAIRDGRDSTLADRVRGGAEITSRDVEDAAEAGDHLSSMVWREACLYLAIACVNLQHTLNPGRIVLGGGLAGAGERLLGPVRAEFDRQTWSLHSDAPEIVLATLGYDAGMIGAAGLAWEAHGPSRG